MYDNDLEKRKRLKRICDENGELTNYYNELADINKKIEEKERKIRRLAKAFFNEDNLEDIFNEYEKIYKQECPYKEDIAKKFGTADEVTIEDVNNVIHLINEIEEEKSALNKIDEDFCTSNWKKFLQMCYDCIYNNERLDNK